MNIMGNIIIGVGNAGTNCIKMAADTLSLSDVEMYAIDSVASQIDINNITKIKYFPIQADEKSGSGRSRERGSEMFKFHESNGLFNDLYEECKKAKEPILVITSAAGGTEIFLPPTVYIRLGQNAAVNLEPSSSVGKLNSLVSYKSVLPPIGMYLQLNEGLT